MASQNGNGNGNVWLNTAAHCINIYERLNIASRDGDIQTLFNLIAEDPNILDQFDQVRFCETPLHIAAKNGKTHFAMELINLMSSLVQKLDVSGFSPIHLALQHNHTRMVRAFIAIDSSLVSIKGRGMITPLHHVAKEGDAVLLSEFLIACPSSVEDLTTKCETAMHVAVKNRKFDAFKVLFGWVQRMNKEEILDWKDEDGNTIFHIAASMNYIEVMELVRRTVKVQAKNLEGKTAMDILQTYQSPLFPEASRRLRIAKETLCFGSTTTLAEYLSKPPSFIENHNKLLGVNNLCKTKQGSVNTNDYRNAVLVVAVLIVTATYQAGLSPPGGFWQENSKDVTVDDDNGHKAGQMTMSFNHALIFYILNGVAFFSSLSVIIIHIIGLPLWWLLYGSIAALAMGYYTSFNDIFPNPKSSIGDAAVALFPLAYPLITGLILSFPFCAFFVNKRRRYRVDFPARYFSSSLELS